MTEYHAVGESTETISVRKIFLKVANTRIRSYPSVRQNYPGHDEFRFELHNSTEPSWALSITLIMLAFLASISTLPNRAYADQ